MDPHVIHDIISYGPFSRIVAMWPSVGQQFSGFRKPILATLSAWHVTIEFNYEVCIMELLTLEGDKIKW